MTSWFNKLISSYRKKRITLTKVIEAYSVKDVAYLEKAYRYGSDYIKRKAVRYLGEFPKQKNFDFLLGEMKATTDLKLKANIFHALLCMAAGEEIQISDQDSDYLFNHFDLLHHLGYKISYSNKSKPVPISFRDKLKDHLGILEEMKKRNDMS